MLDLLNFHSCFGHNGDIHFSREFIKHFIAAIPAKKYTYTHNKSKRSTLDIPNLEYVRADRGCPGQQLWHLKNNVLSINVWNGCRHNKYFGPFDKVKPFEGTFIRSNHHMFTNLILELRSVKINVPLLKPQITHYIPTIDYHYYETKGIDSFIATTPKTTKILICNGPCLCNQITNFSFDALLKTLATDKRLTVITTERRNIPGIHFTGDIIKVAGGDLNEISYLSRFCKIIMGRGSGPYCFSEVKENVHDIRKRMIGITRDRGWAFWWHNPQNMRWTSSFHVNNLIDMLYRSLQEVNAETIRAIKIL